MRLDVIVAFCRSAADVERNVHALGPRIRPAGALWIAPLGLVDNKVAAIDTDWSGLRLVWRRENR